MKPFLYGKGFLFYSIK